MYFSHWILVAITNQLLLKDIKQISYINILGFGLVDLLKHQFLIVELDTTYLSWKFFPWAVITDLQFPIFSSLAFFGFQKQVLLFFRISTKLW
jgi:hypothetical protein